MVDDNGSFTRAMGTEIEQELGIKLQKGDLKLLG